MDVCYVLTDYPRVIEPAVSVLEMTLDRGDGPRPMRLTRLSPVDVHRSVVAVPIVSVHFFGESEDIEKCIYILAYNEAGLLIAIFTRDEPGWVVDLIWDCDFNGAPASLPSLRLVFKDRRSRDVLLYYFDQVRRGRIANTSLAAALESLAEEIRVIDVIPKSA